MRIETNPLDSYIASTFVKETALMQMAKENARSLFKEGISLSPAEGQLVSFLIRLHACRRVVELGTLTGYSALWILSALSPEGQLWTFEKDPKTAALANETFKDYQKQNLSGPGVQLIVGDALEKLGEIQSQGPFDAVFIDANKGAYAEYLSWAEKNLRSGGLLIADNTLLGGDVITGKRTGKFTEKNIEVMQRFNAYLGNQDNFISTFIPTAEGLTVAIKK